MKPSPANSVRHFSKCAVSCWMWSLLFIRALIWTSPISAPSTASVPAILCRKRPSQASASCTIGLTCRAREHGNSKAAVRLMDGGLLVIGNKAEKLFYGVYLFPYSFFACSVILKINVDFAFV